MNAQGTNVRSAVIGAALIVFFSSSAFAQKAPAKGSKAASAPAPVAAPASANPAPSASKKPDDKVDISDLENKYWAPKDTDFSVVQNRTYAKDGRFFITAQYGVPVNDPYSEGSLYGGTFNYFFSERYGVQANCLTASLKNNDSTNDLVNYGSGVQPNHNKLSGYCGVGFNWVPFYAKMSFLGKKILYFDMAFTPHIGMTEYEKQIEGANAKEKSFTYGIDLTQFFFFTNYFAIRLDLKNQWHPEEIVEFRGVNKGKKVNDKQIHDTLFLIGATFFF